VSAITHHSANGVCFVLTETVVANWAIAISQDIVAIKTKFQRLKLVSEEVLVLRTIARFWQVVAVLRDPVSAISLLDPKGANRLVLVTL